MSGSMDEDEIRALVWRHAGAVGTCMMVTDGAAGKQARPMRGVHDSADNAIWFFTDRDSDKICQAAEECGCCLTFADTGSQTFVSMTGKLTVVEDRALIEKHWSEGASVYFPGGTDDRSMVMLRFTPEFASYWDAPSNPVVLAIKFLQAKVTGERPALGDTQSTWMS
jgi:general stress protein 26